MYEAYSTFAAVYDKFMDNVPYKEWADYVAKVLNEHGICDGLVLDLGCGSGTITELLAAKGYDMIGIDISEDMLAIAGRKREESGHDILYLNQDMRSFELYGTVRAIVSLCDSMNYILKEEELLEVFGLVNNYLDYGGLFIFDMNTPYKYEKLLADNTFAENREDASFIWENYYDPDTKINEYDLTLYIEEEDGLFARFEEVHEQRSYETERVKELLIKAGLEIIGTAGDKERMYFIARRPDEVL